MKKQKVNNRLPDAIYQEMLKVVDIVKKGGIILYPTDTIWGIGCDATNSDAVEKVNLIKKRPKDQSLVVLLDNDNKLQRHVREVPEAAWDIIDVTNKPTTIIYDEGYNISRDILAEDGSIGIRIVTDKFCQELIKKLGKPLVSTSANLSGEPSPRSFRDISEDIKSKVDYIVNYRQGETKPAKSSTIIKLGVNGDVKILRR